MWAMLSMPGHDQAEHQVDHEQPAELAHERAALRSRTGRWTRSAANSRPNRPKIAPEAPTAGCRAALNANDASDPPAANSR